ncbi:winged helix-turn-helix transcriptional regulator [Bacillus sp. AGMB 02131]|uniref:Winged helix-turn-helix transcriptional regulator n=1 Tax=Peribacillus faecalis TaxID=2772559 RepID=A0A927H9P7_9BACI|nr:winged helix-turn-helix domain-containing protein [Peribacillus faecalis]MBD3107109.1 winged helix-turn-helix transcriptional regulator [Peribacillus faecalis]
MFEQKNIKIITNHNQLKVLGDPFKNQVLTLLLEQAYTGQQLAKMLEVARSKVHYALTELENNGLIHVVQKEEKNGIVQKFYRAVARSFIPDEQLLPQANDFEEFYRSFYLNIWSRAKVRALTAPDEAFQKNKAKIAMQFEVKMEEEKFKAWLDKYKTLVNELFESEEEDEDGNYYYLSTIGFQIDDPLFEDDKTFKGCEQNDN